MKLFETSRFLVSCLVLLWIKQIKGALNDVTTVYKFHRFETDSNEEQYYNTCSVWVHVDNKLQLPLFNMNGEGGSSDSLLPGNTIPPLYSDQGTSTWFQMRNDNTTLPLPEIQSVKTLVYNILDIDSSIIDGIRNSYEMDTIEEIPVTEFFGTLLANEKFLKNLTNTRTILEITFDAPKSMILYLQWKKNSYIFVAMEFESGGEMNICYKINGNKNNCSDIPQKYTKDENGLFRIDIDITDNITVIHQASSTTHNTPIHVPKIYNGYTKIEHYIISGLPGVSYKIKQQSSVTLVSPWIDGVYNNSLFVLYAGLETSHFRVYLEVQNTSHQIQLDCEEINHVKNTDGLDISLIKINLASTADNGMDQKRIKIIASGDVTIVNVWEGRRFGLYRIQESQPCVKSDIRDIYNTPLDHSTTAESGKVSHCFNGGELNDNSICICPPGFAGQDCETPCSRNMFGSNCSKQCSRSGSECQGLVLCTPEYGCSCAPGYEGDYCSKQCEPGFYGADCKQECGQCKGECDIYTGHCHEGCNTTYLIRPQCKQSHSYLKSSGKVTEIGVNKIYFQIDFTPNNLVKYNDNTLFYILQYQDKDSNSSWINATYGDLDNRYFKFEEGIIHTDRLINFTGWNQFRTILLDEALETHDPSLTEPFEFEYCEGETLKVKNKTNTSIGLSWVPEIDGEPTACHTNSYILEVNQIETDNFHKERVITTVRNSYQIKNLSPGQTYHIQLKKLVNDFDYVPLSSTNVTTDEVIDLSNNIIMGVTISKNKSVVHVEWFESPIHTTFYVKYKLRRYLSCTKQETASTPYVASTSNTFYDLELKDLESNALYELFVTGDMNQNVNPHNKSFTTTLDKETWKCNTV
ncbi:hypothetical protein WDU94_011156 [Cyamophila willieti]